MKNLKISLAFVVISLCSKVWATDVPFTWDLTEDVNLQVKRTYTDKFEIADYVIKNNMVHPQVQLYITAGYRLTSIEEVSWTFLDRRREREFKQMIWQAQGLSTLGAPSPEETLHERATRIVKKVNKLPGESTHKGYTLTFELPGSDKALRRSLTFYQSPFVSPAASP